MMRLMLGLLVGSSDKAIVAEAMIEREKRKKEREVRSGLEARNVSQSVTYTHL